VVRAGVDASKRVRSAASADPIATSAITGAVHVIIE
jgi:hypothetical protein